MSDVPAILCEIHAGRRLGADLAHVAEFCARETGLALEVVNHDVLTPEPVLTLHAGTHQAGGQHPVWCLVCRLACFCPQARVGVLVHARDRFNAAPAPRTRRHSA